MIQALGSFMQINNYIKPLLRLLVIFILSFTPVIYYYYGPISTYTGIYLNHSIYTVITFSAILLIIKKRNILINNIFNFSALILLLVLLPLFIVINGSISDELTINQASRFAIWALISLIILFIDKEYFNLKIFVKSAYLYTFWVIMSIALKFYLDDLYILLYDLASKNDVITTVVNLESDDVVVRFFVPGLNSNTVVILSMIYFIILYTNFKNNRGKKLTSVLHVLCMITLLVSILLTYSRMAFIFLLIMFLVEIFLNKDKLLPKFIFPVLLFMGILDKTIYYRFLNAADSLFGTSLSEGKTESTSDRSVLINDSLDWLIHNPFGGGFTRMVKTHPGAAGEHLLFLFITNNFGILIGLIFFLFLFFFIISDFRVIKSIKYEQRKVFNSLFAIQLILFLSCFVAPSYYIQFLFVPIISKAISNKAVLY